MIIPAFDPAGQGEGDRRVQLYTMNEVESRADAGRYQRQSFIVRGGGVMVPDTARVDKTIKLVIRNHVLPGSKARRPLQFGMAGNALVADDFRRVVAAAIIKPANAEFLGTGQGITGHLSARGQLQVQRRK